MAVIIIKQMDKEILVSHIDQNCQDIGIWHSTFTRVVTHLEALP